MLSTEILLLCDKLPACSRLSYESGITSQELQRDFTLGVNFAISFTIITILTAVTGLFGLALTYGGRRPRLMGDVISLRMGVYFSYGASTFHMVA